MQNLKGRSFLKILDFEVGELQQLLHLSHNVKKQKKGFIKNKVLDGKTFALLFQKDSTRTRCAFEVAIKDLGGDTVFIGPSGSQFGKKESVEDTAKVLGRMFDGIAFRGFLQSDVEKLSACSNVPVWNGLTDQWHPTQMIADFMTMEENFNFNLKNKKLVFVGNGKSNVARSLLVFASKFSMHFVLLCPKELQPERELWEKCLIIAKKNSSKIEITQDWKYGTNQANIIYTDVWVSMGEENWRERIKLLIPYQVNMEMLENANKDVIFLHCLPSFHDEFTLIGKQKSQEYGKEFPKVQNGEFEVTNEVFLSKYSKVFDQAENRLHSIKSIILSTI